jgi:hypothetical protein
LSIGCRQNFTSATLATKKADSRSKRPKNAARQSFKPEPSGEFRPTFDGVALATGDKSHFPPQFNHRSQPLP